MIKKCRACGKSVTDPYTHTIVPPTNVYEYVKPYDKRAVKTKRVELDGIIIYNYCDRKCYENSHEWHTLNT